MPISAAQAENQDLLAELEQLIVKLDSRDRSDAELVDVNVVLKMAVLGLRLALATERLLNEAEGVLQLTS